MGQDFPQKYDILNCIHSDKLNSKQKSDGYRTREAVVRKLFTSTAIRDAMYQMICLFFIKRNSV